MGLIMGKIEIIDKKSKRSSEVSSDDLLAA